MEAIAILGFACNIIQVLDAAHSAAETIVQVYKHGAALDHAHLEQITNNLGALNLETRVDDAQLQAIAQSCRLVSKALHDELAFLKGTGKRDALRIGFRAFRKKGDIEKMRSKLAEHERTFSTGLLMRLKEQTDAAAITQRAAFTDLDTVLQNFVTNLANNITSFEQILREETLATRNHVTQEHTITRTHVDSVLLQNTTEQQNQRFLDSLKYPLMNARRNQISSKCPKTFEWVFRETNHWSSFPKWLASPDATYFVEGKAASGKSTLMKFVAEDPRTQKLLEIWKPSVKVLSHYFWLSGDISQRSLHGMLTSLVYQILVGHDGAIPHDLPLTKQHPSDWSLIELSALLHELTAHDQYCVFLDGLDEFDGDDPRSLTDLIEDLSSSSNIKICLSSRPERIYLQQLQFDVRFHLHELTKPDIEEFVVSRLTRAQAEGRLAGLPIDNSLIESIVQRAEGVFLWVHIALNSVIRGLESYAPMSELEARVTQLPQDIGGLYEDMLKRLGDDWELVKFEAAFVLRFMVIRQLEQKVSPHTYELVIAKALFDGEPETKITNTYLSTELSRMMTRIPVVCAGLVEVHETALPYRFQALESSSRFSQDLRLSKLDKLLCYSVSFIHRTAYDFVRQQPMGQSIMQLCDLEFEQILHLELQATMIASRCRGFPLGWSGAFTTLREVNVNISSRPEITTECKMVLLRYAHRSILVEAKIEHDRKLATLDVAATTNLVIDSELEYRLAKNDPKNRCVAIDFMGLTLEAGRPEYFHHYLLPILANCEQQELLDVGYLNYLLLCASRFRRSFDSPSTHASYHELLAIIKLLISAGANPYAVFHHGPGFPLRATAAVCMHYNMHIFVAQLPPSPDSQSDANYVSALLMYDPFMVPWHQAFFDHSPAYVVVQTPAEAMSTEGRQSHAHHSYIQGRVTGDDRPKPHRKVVLVSSGQDKDTVWETSNQDSVELLQIMDEENGRSAEFSGPSKLLTNRIREITNRSHGISRNQYLKDHGYLKDPSDPLVPQGPIRRFRDGVDASKFPVW